MWDGAGLSPSPQWQCLWSYWILTSTRKSAFSNTSALCEKWSYFPLLGQPGFQWKPFGTHSIALGARISHQMMDICSIFSVSGLLQLQHLLGLFSETLLSDTHSPLSKLRVMVQQPAGSSRGILPPSTPWADVLQHTLLSTLAVQQTAASRKAPPRCSAEQCLPWPGGLEEVGHQP